MDPNTITFAIGAPLMRADLPGLCRRICLLLERTGATLALCDVHGVAADAVAVDALARLQLAARRRGAQVRLRRASEELVSLIAFLGLENVVPEASPRASAEVRTAGTDGRSRGST